jgi:hypothetical protein
MSVALLQATGAGKMVRKTIKAFRKKCIDADLLELLEGVLNSWKLLAGIDVRDSPEQPSDKNLEMQQRDMETAESCQTWRQLFDALSQREEEQRTSQGKRMRQIRRDLAASRPKLVKVRPTQSSKNPKYMLGRTASSPPSSLSLTANDKMAQLRREAVIQTAKRRRVIKKASFGDAVAFCAGSKKGADHRKRKVDTVQLAGGKRMKVPLNLAGRGKWKTK